MTRFLHARLHWERLRELLAAQDRFSDDLLTLVLVLCPTCGHEFFADIRPTQTLWKSALLWLESDKRSARFLLECECPDHAHRFAVGP